MFKPERMSLLQIVLLNEDVVSACDVFAKEKVVHLVDRAVVAPTLREGTPAFFSGAHASLEKINEQLNIISELLDYPKLLSQPASKNKIVIDPQKVSEEIKPVLEEKLQEVKNNLKETEDKNKKITQLIKISDTLQSFENSEISYNEIEKFKYFKFVAGTMPVKHLSDLRKSLCRTEYHLEIRKLDQSEVSIIVFCPSDVLSLVQNALKSLYLSQTIIPEEFQDEPREALDRIEMELWQLREELAILNKSFHKLRKGLFKKYAEWKRVATANLIVLNAMHLFGKTSRATFINGWVPKNKVDKIISVLKEKVSECIAVEVSNPDEKEGKASELKNDRKIKVPTKFRHPKFLKPFETLITTYGYPDYDGIDPTFFVAITFLLMFGMMFGDVGHGLVLIIIGLIIAFSKTFKTIKDTGWLVLSMGVTSTIFGFLFGEFFGPSHIIPALWIHPTGHVKEILGVALGIGILVISLGIILNVIQSFKNKNFKETFFGQWGLFSGVFYWMVLFVFYLSAQSNKTPVWLIVSILIIPILFIVIGDIFYDNIFGKSSEVEGEEHSFAEIIFKPVEIVLGFTTHTISFVRVGAFALNHAALMVVVFTIAGLSGNFTDPEAGFTTKFGYVLALIVGNIFVVALEALIVFIQCLRLQYYEFFSKFFEGKGVKYEPLNVEISNNK